MGATQSHEPPLGRATTGGGNGLPAHQPVEVFDLVVEDGVVVVEVG